MHKPTRTRLADWWHRFVAAHLVAVDPSPASSRLDRWDGQR